MSNPPQKTPMEVDPIPTEQPGDTPPGPGDKPTEHVHVERGDDDVPEKPVKEVNPLLPPGELSEEDVRLKTRLEEAAAVVINPESAVDEVVVALTTLRSEIQSSTSSMTAIPKPLKFLRPSYEALKTRHRAIHGTRHGRDLADILAVLSMAVVPPKPAKGAKASLDVNATLRYKSIGNARDLASWGHELIRAVGGQAAREHQLLAEESTSESKEMEVEIFPPKLTQIQLNDFVNDVVPHEISHNAEADAVDLLYEVSRLDELKKYITNQNYERLVLYLFRLADYCPSSTESRFVLGCAFDILVERSRECDALIVALKARDNALVERAMEVARVRGDPLVRKQMAAVLGGHRAFWYDCEKADEDLEEIVANTRVKDWFKALARELNVEEAKTPEDVYKSALSETGAVRREAQAVQSSRQNLASTFVNAFVNAGFGHDKLVTPESSTWINTFNKADGMISATASIGMVYLWNVDEGMQAIDKYLYATDVHIRSGALLALGICNSGVRDPVEPAIGILPGYLEADRSFEERACAALGLGLAYSANPKAEIADILLPLVGEESESDKNFDLSCFSALALGYAFVGTGDEAVSMSLIQKICEAPAQHLGRASARYLAVALGLVFLQRQELAEAALEVLQTVEHPFSKFAQTILTGCAFAGTGNVLEIQKMLHMCTGEVKPEGTDSAAEGAAAATEADGATAQDATSPGGEASAAAGAGSESAAPADGPSVADVAKANLHQSAAVLAVAMIASGETVGRDMSDRMFRHLLTYGDIAVRRAVPLALGITHASHPEFGIVDILSRLTHDPDTGTAMAAILALGLVGSGTNNARIAGLLRLLATFYAKDSGLFVVRLAQGLLHAGKGLVTLAPYIANRSVMFQPAMAGILTLAVSGLELKATLLGPFHYVMYALAQSLRPRCVMAVDPETLQPQVNVQVRVGVAVETVGQAGRPKQITGFQTHISPALLSVGERAELAEPDTWMCSTRTIEGVVFAQKTREALEKEAAEKLAVKKP